MKSSFMTRSCMRNNYLKCRPDKNKRLYNKKINYCVSLNEKFE